MADYRLLESGSAVADANGVATVHIGPQRAFERWHVRTVTVQSTSTTLVPELREFRGFISESNLVGASHTGNLDVGRADHELESGETLIYRWTNCDVGATCTVVVEGTSSRD